MRCSLEQKRVGSTFTQTPKSVRGGTDISLYIICNLLVARSDGESLANETPERLSQLDSIDALEDFFASLEQLVPVEPEDEVGGLVCGRMRGRSC